MQPPKPVEGITGYMDVYEDATGTQVDLVLPFQFVNSEGNRQHIRTPIRHFDGFGRNEEALQFASSLGMSCVPLYRCRIFQHREKPAGGYSPEYK